MWKRLLVLALVHWKLMISSEQVNDETGNKRASRQLDFGDCCPCPGHDAFQEQRAAIANLDTASVGDDNCPCRSSDSEGASSIVRPAFRAADPFVRPVTNKEERKPLLNPEVGLASSVLETLREVTDQEYQDALARDAARGAMKILNPELTESEPRNIVNVIVSPKEENHDDTISEATEIEPSSCILPPLSSNNNEHLLQPPMKLLKNLLTSPKISNNGILNRKRLDMDGSASNTQERITQPFKTNILDNLMTRSNLLNLKPLSSTDNRDFLNSPNILQKHYAKNNIRDRTLLRNKPLLDIQPKTINKLNELYAKKTVGYKDVKPDEFGDSVSNLKVSAEDNIEQNTDCTKNSREPTMPLKYHFTDIDEVPSASKIIEVTNPSIKENINVIEQNRNANIFSDKVTATYTEPNNFSNLQTTTEIYSNPKSSEVTKELMVEDEQTNDSEIENTTDHFQKFKDTVFEPSITRNIDNNLQDAVNNEYSTSNEDERKQINSMTLKKNLTPSTSAEKDKINSKINPNLPNIKADIYRTLEKFKKANEKIQEKLRSNVQDALQFVIPNDPQHTTVLPDTEPNSKMRASSLEQSQELINNETTTNQYMTTQDLQQMSDSLLKVEQSSLEYESETSTISYNKEEFKNDPKYISAEVFDRESDNIDMNTSPTNLNVKSTNNLEDRKSNLYPLDENISKTDEIAGNVCAKNIQSKNSGSIKTNIEENEMTAQPSNSVFKSLSQLDLNRSKLGLLQKDLVFQPEDNIKPKEASQDSSNNYRLLSTDTLTNDDEDSVFFAYQPLLGSKNNRNIDSSKRINQDFASKFHSDTNLSSYKAKVASPKTLDIKSLAPTLPFSPDKEADILGLASQRIPYSLKNILKSNVGNGFDPLFKPEHNPKMIQDTISSIVPSISDHFQSHTNNALKTFRDSLDLAQREPFRVNKKNLFREPLINTDNLFGAMLKTHEDLNDKFQVFQSDLNERLSTISPKLSSDSSRLLWPPSRLRNSKNLLHNNIGMVPDKTKISNMKATLLSKNKPYFESIKKKTADTALRTNINDMLRPNVKQRLGILPHQTDFGTRKGLITTDGKSYLNKPKNKIKLKPLKENKVTISFATTSIRPDTVKSGLKSIYSSDPLRSRSAVASGKLPKFPKSLTNRKPILKSRSESNDPKISASDLTITKAQFPETSHEESDILHHGNHNYDDRRSANKQEVNNRKTLLLSKIKNAFASRISSEEIKKNDKVLSSKQNENVVDAAQSASNTIGTNISASSLAAGKLKDNKTLKCKMVCIQDILDSIDA